MKDAIKATCSFRTAVCLLLLLTFFFFHRDRKCTLLVSSTVLVRLEGVPQALRDIASSNSNQKKKIIIIMNIGDTRRSKPLKKRKKTRQVVLSASSRMSARDVVITLGTGTPFRKKDNRRQLVKLHRVKILSLTHPTSVLRATL